MTGHDDLSDAALLPAHVDGDAEPHSGCCSPATATGSGR